MKKTYTKFQINQYKTVRGVALTKGIHCLYIEGEKWLNSQCRKSDKKCSNNYTQITCTSSYHEKTYAKFQNNRYKTLRGVSLTRGTHCLYVLTILPKPHGHPHTMKKTHAKFQNNPYKTIRGVALTMTKFTMWKKVTKDNLAIISRPHAHLHTMPKTHAKFQNDWYKTGRGVALTRHPG